jgi:DHA2 family multidrug resistance protein
MATTLESMIVWRALQGFLGGAMIPICFAVSFTLFTGPKRIAVSVLISLTATMAPTIGPSFGGWLTDVLSWPWLFLINVPIGLMVGTLVWCTLDIDRPDYALLRRFDWLGLLWMAIFLGTAEYVMEEGPRWGWLDDDNIAVFAAVCLASGLLFFWRTLTRHEPLIELRAFRNANFRNGCLLSMVVGVGLFGLVYVLPLFLARVRSYSSLEIGATLFITGATMFMTAPLAGRLARLLDLRLMLAMGFCGFAVSCFWIAELTYLSGFWEMAAPLALRGSSLIFMFMPVNQITFGTLSPAEIKNAAALYNLMRNLGGAFGLAAINSVLIWRGAVHRQHLAESLQWGRPHVQDWLDTVTQRVADLQAALPAEAVALRRLQMLQQREALVLSYNDVLLLMALLFVCVLPLILLVDKPRVPGGAGH